VPKNTHKQAICTNSTDYSINSHSKYNHVKNGPKTPIIAQRKTSTQKPTKRRLHCTYEWGFLPVHSYMYSICILYHAVTKSLSYKFCLGLSLVGNGKLRNAKVRKVICKITCEKCVRKIGKMRKIHLCEIGVCVVLRTV